MLLLLAYIFNIVGGRRGICGGMVASHHHGIYLAILSPLIATTGGEYYSWWMVRFSWGAGRGFREMFHLYISLLDLLIWLYRLRREEMKENWDSCVSPRGHMALPLLLRTSPVIVQSSRND